MATRKKGKPGSIFFDKTKGKWRGKIPNGVRDDGVFLYKFVYGDSKAEVERKLTAFEKEREKRQGLVNSEDTLNDYMIRDNELDYRKRLIKESTYTRRIFTQQTFAQFYLSKIPIQNITRRHIEEFLSEITVYSNSVIHKIWQMMNKAFNQAVWDNVITRNPLDPAGGIKMPKSQKPDKEVTALTVLEEQKVVSALVEALKAYNPKKTPYKNCYAPQLLLELYTGMRSGEVNALTLEDIDLEHHRIYVHYTVARGENYRSYIGPTKTKAGTRTVLLDDNACAATFDNVVLDESLEVGSSSWSFNECSGAYKNEDEFFENMKGCIECEIEQARASGYFGEGSPLHFNLKVQLEYNKNYGDYYYTCYTLYLA